MDKANQVYATFCTKYAVGVMSIHRDMHLGVEVCCVSAEYGYIQRRCIIYQWMQVGASNLSGKACSMHVFIVVFCSCMLESG
jgi:hypothetical protein